MVRQTFNRELMAFNHAGVLIAFGICLVWPSVVSASQVIVGFRDRGEINVPEKETVTQTDLVSVDAHGRLSKLGKGELRLSRQALVQPTALKMDVLDGTVEVFEGTPISESCPECLQKAALWLDASSENLVTTNGVGLASSDCLKAWYDVREADVAHPSFSYAIPDWWRNDTEFSRGYGVVPPCKVSPYGGMTGVYFGGYADDDKSAYGQSVRFVKSDGSANLINDIYHVFAVYAYSNTWGNVFGSWAGTDHSARIDFMRGYGSFFNQQTGGAVAMSTGNFYLDGKWADGAVENPAKYVGLHLMECELLNRLACMQTLFSGQGWSVNRNGGDYLYEVVVFTNKLSASETASVRRYLMNHWNIPLKGLTEVPVMALSDRSTLRLSADAGNRVTLGADVDAVGNGKIVKSGSGELSVPCSQPGSEFSGKLDFQDGNVELRRPVTIVAHDGVSYDVASDPRGNYIAPLAAPSGDLTKTGRGRLQLDGLPAGTKRLEVKGGVLKLTAPRLADTDTAVTGTVAVIQDHSFESYTSDPTVSDSGRIHLDLAGELSPWTHVLQSGAGGAGSPGIAVYWMERFNSTWPSNGYRAPDGNISFYLKGDTAAYTVVQIPSDGVYEFSFYATARSLVKDGSKQNHLDIAIGDDLDHLTWFGNLIRINDPYTRFFYKTPYLRAGEHKLWFRAHVLNIDGTTTIDDLKLVRINDPEENVVKVPNGDFEKVADRAQVYLVAENTTEGWALDNSWVNAGRYAPATIVTANSLSGNSESAMRMFDVGGINTYGFAALGLFSTGGVARTTAQFVPPAGRYRLRADVGKWGIAFYDLVKNDGSTVDLSGTPKIRARVTVGGVAHDLGEYAVATQRNQPHVWEPSFTTDGKQAVVIEFWNTVANGGAEVDNVVLVPQDGLGGNILRNPSFEENSSGVIPATVANWTLAANKVDFGVEWSSVARVDKYDRSPANYALRRLDGDYRLCLCGLGSASQFVDLEEGVYRLKFYAYARHNPSGSDVADYGMNPIRAYLTQGSVTNEIGWTYVDCTNYVETAFLFRSPGAGTYTFTLQGMAVPGVKWNPDQKSTTDNTSMIDFVSLERVDDAAVAPVPDIDQAAVLSVDDGARLELDYSGRKEVSEVRYAGRRVSGVISQATHPEFVSGPGELFAEPRGAVLVFR